MNFEAVSASKYVVQKEEIDLSLEKPSNSKCRQVLCCLQPAAEASRLVILGCVLASDPVS